MQQEGFLHNDFRFVAVAIVIVQVANDNNIVIMTLCITLLIIVKSNV